MDIRSFMQNVRGSPSNTYVRKGSASSRKKPKNIVRGANIILNNKDEDSLVKEHRQKKGKDRAATSSDMVNIVMVPAVIPSPLSSPLVSPPRPLIGNTFGLIVDHSPLKGSIRFMPTGGETQTLFPWHNSVKKPSLKKLILSFQVALAKACMVSVGIAEGINEKEVRKVEFGNVHQSTVEALERACELHKQLDKENKNLVE
ncbi:hypothetical protein J1N35_021825 [Gossypium stocksii]|uniref:Uncharacterized protein n=1 Tax=Gossypium stocksii TaxID=47602 RepID=A0A9D3VGJ7_9ROSI|nr:hypothetical protein J1N35_021825 [Gossypium stocksii]